jgi:RNA polymerase sigma factor (sigma-70 family)
MTVHRASHKTGHTARHRAERGRAPERLPDGVLLRRARRGDDAAFAELYRRHAEWVSRHAREGGLDADTAEDLTEEAFAQTLQALRDGGGPSASLRDHLLATVRRMADERRERAVASQARETTQLSAEAQAMVQADKGFLVTAFSSLPGRWQEVLWRTAVERQSLGRVGSELGLTTNATAVLAFRAREGLRQAYLQAHVSDELAGREDCRRYAGKLGAFIRGSSASRGLRRHLDVCDRCRAAYLELVDVNATLRAVFPVAVVGSIAAAAAVTAAGSAPAEAAAAAGGSGGVLAKLAVAASVALAAGSAGQGGVDSGFGSGDQANAAASVPDAEPGAATAPAGSAESTGNAQDAGNTPPPARPDPRPEPDGGDPGPTCLPGQDSRTRATVITHVTDVTDIVDLDCAVEVTPGDTRFPGLPEPSARPGDEEVTEDAQALRSAVREVTDLAPEPAAEPPGGEADGIGLLPAPDAQSQPSGPDPDATDAVTGLLP